MVLVMMMMMVLVMMRSVLSYRGAWRSCCVRTWSWTKTDLCQKDAAPPFWGTSLFRIMFMNLSKSGPWTYIIFHVHGLDNHQHCVSPRPWHCARGRSLGERGGRRLRRRLCAAGYRGGGDNKEPKNNLIRSTKWIPPRFRWSRRYCRQVLLNCDETRNAGTLSSEKDSGVNLNYPWIRIK